MCNKLVDEIKGNPDLVVSTAHKAKGREWNTVQVSSDFQPPKPDEEPRQDEMRLAYVTVTRGKLVLSRGSLAWPRDRGESGRVTARKGLGLDPYAGEMEPSAAERLGITEEEMREAGI
jgi:superfamily I DNA/RNA helicase